MKYNKLQKMLRCVHMFDGRLVKVPIQNRTINEKNILFRVFMERINRIIPVKYSVIIRNLEVIINDTQQPANYLSSDNIYADDILAEIIDIMMRKRDIDIMTVLFEELLDIETGRCPSGRCVRLYQVLLALRRLNNFLSEDRKLLIILELKYYSYSSYPSKHIRIFIY